MSGKNRRKGNGDCKFCCDEADLKTKVPIRDSSGRVDFYDCVRWIDENEFSIVTLDPIQHSRGHALVILKSHSDDLLDPTLKTEEYHGLVKVVRKVAKRMKDVLRCKRVYVATLCDGVEHLHYHLVPRYAEDIKGFTFLGSRELLNRSGYVIGPNDPMKRAKYLEDLAKKLRVKFRSGRDDDQGKV